ncbi:MAG TPA: response regulator transcription factor [Pirellulales bacterium]|jgi:DNA-binding NarL/FixJ family response regulator|nr:response regulator transcription factor [Pirellulales bacterium]
MPTRLLIVDDHEVVRKGIANLLEGTDLEVVGMAASGNEALKVAQELRPDVVLLDIRMTEGDGLSTLEEMRQALPDCRVIMLSTYDNPTYIARANALGASDYLLKDTTREQLVGAINAVAAGDAPSSFGELRRVAGTMATRQKQEDVSVALTQRETQVLRHLALGLSNKEIGRSLSISIETVKEHVQHLLRKIDATDRTQAAVWAVRKGLV